MTNKLKLSAGCGKEGRGRSSGENGQYGKKIRQNIKNKDPTLGLEFYFDFTFILFVKKWIQG